uniref:Guanine nucleotide exchange factor DBS-like spectrin-like domain-containing protein n=1 Tax=Ascaris lumbricoides TaxID=6252 RepID=A0A0M3IQ05_ASCLU
MHACPDKAKANKWCKRGVDLLTAVPLDVSPTSAAVALTSMDDFIADGQCLKLDALSQSPTMNNLILLTTTETSTLLAQLDALSQSPTMNNLILLTTTETSTLLAQVSTLPVEIY